MHIGERLRQARLEAGLSQRQLCGDLITRNMLSQIENGSAQPSMTTLRSLAQKLDKPVSWFLQEQTASANQSLILDARAALAQGDHGKLLTLLRSYAEPDGVFDPERYYMEALAQLALAQEAISADKLPYAQKLLTQAALAGGKTPYYTPELERRRLLLCCRADPENISRYVQDLPSLQPELFARAMAEAPENRLPWLNTLNTPEGVLLKGETLLQLGDYASAAASLHSVESAFPRQAAAGLEVCYRELKDFEKAYYYACRLREAPL